MMSDRLRRAHDDRGDTLVEIVISVVILAIAGAALMGGVLTSITSSSEHRTLTVNDTYLRSYANSAAEQLQRKTNPKYQACPSVGDLNDAITTPDGIPSGVVSVQSVQFWTGGVGGGASQWSSDCATAEDASHPVELITVGSIAPGQKPVSFVVRDPSTVVQPS